MEQLRVPMPSDRLVGWIVTVVITALAFFLRCYKIGFPSTIMFDETYYAKDGFSVWQYGYEGLWTDPDGDPGPQPNLAFSEGDTSYLTSAGRWASHPPLGSWLIGAGMKLFGVNSFGWRFAALVFGTLLVFVTIRLARRLSRSTLIGGLAGFLLAVDGMAFVMSRIALLDIFQAFFIVAAVSCIIADRDFFRNKLADHLATLPGETLGGRAGPFIFRPWLLAAGLLFGLACGTKWNSMYPLAVFGVVAVVWSLTARHLAGAGRRMWWSLIKDGLQAFVTLVVVAVVTYLAVWIPWLRATGGYGRDWGLQNPDSWVTRTFGEAIAGLYRWHWITYDFHTGDGMAHETHTYQSNPWLWLVDGRTTGIYADNGINPGVDGCQAAADSSCLRVITATGTPLLWWAVAIALVAALVWWLAGMDWRFGVAVLGYGSTWLPWLFVGTRPIFSFYTITMIPFGCIALAMALGVLLGPRLAGPRRQIGAIIVGVIVALIVLDFALMYPVYTGGLLTRQQYYWRMWLPGWI
jgi:dolichyl-phosphate-mannose--protein O-mannosyl transferase